VQELLLTRPPRTTRTQLDAGCANVPTFIIKPSSGTMGRGISLVQTVGLGWAACPPSSVHHSSAAVDLAVLFSLVHSRQAWCATGGHAAIGAIGRNGPMEEPLKAYARDGALGLVRALPSHCTPRWLPS